jgi:hypothetical protein
MKLEGNRYAKLMCMFLIFAWCIVVDGVISSGVSSHILPESRDNINECVCT